METAERGELATEGAPERYERRVEAIREVIEVAEACARALGSGSGSAVDLGSVSSALAQRVLPHVDSDAALFEATHRDASRLDDQRRQLARLIERLDLIRRHLLRFRGSSSVRGQLQRSLGDLIDVLRQHLHDDLAVRESLTHSDLAPSVVDALLDQAVAAERASTQSLRFVWQPPVPATQAFVLRDNPTATRVQVLTGTGRGEEAPARAVQPPNEEVTS